jgi:hypothetical protein
MIDWKDPDKELPNYAVKVLLWQRCEKCHKKEPHTHKLLMSPELFPESFSTGYYSKADPEHLWVYKGAQREDRWSPVKPYRWAYVNPPE